jgi:hypothetical protein
MRPEERNQAQAAAGRFLVRDGNGCVLGEAQSHAMGRDLLISLFLACVMTAPGAEEDLYLATVAIDGRELLREDIYELGTRNPATGH